MLYSLRHVLYSGQIAWLSWVNIGILISFYYQLILIHICLFLGRMRCEFDPVSSVFGEICPDVHKFLSLNYSCVGMFIYLKNIVIQNDLLRMELAIKQLKPGQISNGMRILCWIKSHTWWLPHGLWWNNINCVFIICL